MTAPGPGEGTVVVVGFGITGRAVTAHLAARGRPVVVVEDDATDATADEVAALGASLGPVSAVEGASLVVPSPGVGPHHPVHAAARAAGVPVWSEVELAWRAAEGKRVVAVTGTNGKTTVATLVAAILVASGTRAVAAGNIGLPLVTAATADVEVLVAEVSSFQLEYTVSFRPDVAVWLNLAPDHLDWHPTMEHYAAAKARIWANQGPAGVAVVNADDPAVMAAAASAPGRVVTFGLEGADWAVDGSSLRGPDGEVAAVADLGRALPHDLANALAAMAAASAAGAGPGACRAGVAGFAGLPHRVQLVGESGGVRYYDDSKATTPASVLAALRGFASAVLIAGGRNKGLDLGPLAAEAGRLRAVVAIGEAAGEVAAAFAGTSVPVTRAVSMADAVRAAAGAAAPGDAVLLSPACASYDWYRSYAERGDDFAAEVRALAGAHP
ncbi:MAG: UDP-N-acetylmuramoyl-L-alanine--D-glutamate ligase [Actinomycetota bacterium]